MAVGDYFQWLRGTLRTGFKIGKADFDTSALTAARAITVQDLTGIMALETWQVSAQSSNFSTGSAKRTLFEVDVSGGNKVATLSAAATGTILAFKLTTAPGGNTLTFSASIDSDSSLALFMLNDFIVIMYDGSAWKIVGDGRRPHQCMIYNSSSQSLTNSTWTLITYNQDDSDEAGMHSTSSNTDRVTIRRTGNYIMVLYVVFATNTTGPRQVAFNKNGSSTGMPGNSVANPGTGEVLMNTAAPLALAAGDYLQSYAYQGSGGSLSINLAGTPQGLIWSIFEQR